MPAPRLPFDFHDAYIHAVVLGPRREVNLEMDFGSARFSDPRLPPASILRFAAIENFAEVTKFFAPHVGGDGCRIDGMTSTREGTAKAHTRFRIEIDHWGIVEIHCGKATLTPEPASDEAE